MSTLLPLVFFPFSQCMLCFSGAYLLLSSKAFYNLGTLIESLVPPFGALS